MNSQAARLVGAAGVLLILFGASTDLARAKAPAAPPATLHHFPDRPADARGGAEFMRSIRAMTPARQRRAIVQELQRGNVPNFLRRLQPVEVEAPELDGSGRAVVVWVTPDYLSIGSDDDFVRVPLGLYTAATLAREFGCSLPTRKMVDAIHRAAPVHLVPSPMKPGPHMTSLSAFVKHNRRIEAALAGQGHDRFVSGHKKDLVLTNRLVARARKVAIYGWHRRNGRPIQPLSTVHGARYFDYSHGVRLVSTTVSVDGEPRSLYDLLEDPQQAPALTYEGAIPHVRRLMSLDMNATR